MALRKPKRAGRRRRERVVVPALDSPLRVNAAADRRILTAAGKVMDGERSSAKSFLDLEIKEIHALYSTLFDFKPKYQLWPRHLYVPSGDDFRLHWPYGPPPAGNLYGIDWTIAPIGGASASHVDGSLFAFAGSPTVSGAIEGKAEAGVGFLYTATHTLSRIRVEPSLVFTGRHAWSTEADPVVVVTTRVVGTLYVGAFEQNPVTGQFESIPNVPWRAHRVFDVANSGQGASAMVSVPFNLSGQAASGEVLVQLGHTYLIAVVAQTALTVRTTDSSGRPVRVRNGHFDTWGSLAGVVREVWLKETVFLP